MVSITEAFVDSLAPNASAMKNGRDLAKKNSFSELCITADETLIFGECKGSGKEPYLCSVDFLRPETPVFRCSCPSRQFPCKHALGLLYAHTLQKPFEVAEIPTDIADKREKAEKREEKKKESELTDASTDRSKPARKVNKAAFVKKINAQLEGLSILEKLVLQIVHNGLGSIDKKSLQLMEDQAKQLGNYYISGVQAALREIVLMMKSADKEMAYSQVIEQLIRLWSLVKKGKSYLEQRLAEPERPMDTETMLEEQLGHTWQLTELKQFDRIKQDVELLQLSFLSYTDHARSEFVDAGWWVDLQDGTIYTTRHLRPFRAAKSMKEEDTVHALVTAEELYIYPGEQNARIRWENVKFREADAEKFKRVKSLAVPTFQDVIKQVKNGIKSPLALKNPAALIAFHAIERVGDTMVLRDVQGKQLTITNNFISGSINSDSIIPLLPKDDLNDQAALVVFQHDVENRRLGVQLLSIITDCRMIRLLY
ncbi:SWIM zinc finger family protein [Paenibacillus sp. MMS18-CY102]|uniref:SWIM zinc finger family protein n=1 Tax=Paenibacillus sp. MMS18-CY102 TaxID=2682849 RepID=UPI00136543C7|nr:SWIM zinc finger family protein [Paenibacillus sp. MMS18-CY102]MWC29831.1 SWIM zinc finger family protein [Paenibacillus sp. MMS18-CY102]